MMQTLLSIRERCFWFDHLHSSKLKYDHLHGTVCIHGDVSFVSNFKHGIFLLNDARQISPLPSSFKMKIVKDSFPVLAAWYSGNSSASTITSLALCYPGSIPFKKMLK